MLPTDSLLIPGFAFTGCDVIIIPHPLASETDVETKLNQRVHRYCWQRKGNGPITLDLIADCHSVIQPLIESTPHAYWETEEKAP